MLSGIPHPAQHLGNSTYRIFLRHSPAARFMLPGRRGALLAISISGLYMDTSSSCKGDHPLCTDGHAVLSSPQYPTIFLG